MTKKITAFVLSLLLILPSVFGCSARKVEAYSSRPAATVLGVANYGGSTVKVLISERSRDTGDVDISASELFGVTVSTEGYYCRRTAEDELGVIIEYTSAPSVLDALTADAAADMGSYSIAYPTLSEYSIPVRYPAGGVMISIYHEDFRARFCEHAQKIIEHTNSRS